MKAYELKGRVEVGYSRILKYQIGDESVSNRLRKKAAIEPAKKDKLFYLRRGGVLEDPASLRVFGDWAASRMTNDLPIDYSHNFFTHSN